MNKELELEAEKYENSFNDPTGNEAIDFIAGATSKYVEKQKLRFAIKQLNKVLDNEEINKIAFDGVFYLRQELELKLKELENEQTN